MNTRQFNLKNIRPEILSASINDTMTENERFQNLVLRPIIKLQNDLFIEVFKNYIAKHKLMYYEYTLEKRLLFIENAVTKDIKFRNTLKGMIIGLFTVEEYLIYIQNSSALNKRMMQIVKERLISNVQLFKQPEPLKVG